MHAFYRVFERRAMHSLTALARFGLIVNLRSILDFQYRLIAKCDLPFFGPATAASGRGCRGVHCVYTSCLCFNASGGHETQLHTTYVCTHTCVSVCVCVRLPVVC